jgi:hypothetical protein
VAKRFDPRHRAMTEFDSRPGNKPTVPPARSGSSSSSSTILTTLATQWTRFSDLQQDLVVYAKSCPEKKLCATLLLLSLLALFLWLMFRRLRIL